MPARFHELSKSYHGKTVFKNISGEINDGDKVGLVGLNGIGKTTLARLIANRESCDAGKIVYAPPHLRILYIEQHPQFDSYASVYEAILNVPTKNLQQTRDTETIVKKSLNKIGLNEAIWSQRAVSLSGGEKTKLALCRIMVTNFDLLILDEPTNHLDTKSCEWLEEFIGQLDKPMLIISHDRFFLDRAVNKIWELTARGLKMYEGNYSAYRTQKEIELKNMAREYNKQQLKIQHLKQVINTREDWYQSAHQAAGQNDFYRSKANKHANVLKAKRKELERTESAKLDKPVKPVSPAFEVIKKSIRGKKYPPYLVQGQNLGKSFGRNIIFQGISFRIKRGDKIALIGANGVGKTTLLKTICGLDQDYQGTVTINPAVKTGYFAQELNNLPYGATILDSVLTAGTTAAEARLLLANLLFRGDDVYKSIANLSMGERGRVAFAKLILSGADMLILDEPTNYMDIESKEKIESVLEDFKGIILFVCHDRYFIQRVANRIFTIDNQKLNCYDGNYDYYLAKCREQQVKDNIGAAYGQLTDNIRRLECELAFLGAKLNEKMDDTEKKQLNERFLAAAKELHAQKKRLQ
ncbi:MAG TPA: ABC transporter ATP-binding protein [Desulfotomaculum sp.]|nr:MAG: hypothetical protein JL56_07820 [Desulfotomaculum sp. BICA1-6]HBX23288.1 ABC transporter ATP-binding protein [Desulfotomaculum sp.]